jgi:signal transduction histidine kinase
VLPVAAYLLGIVAGAQASVARQLVAPAEQLLGLEITELTRSRVRLVDAFDSERRRIERDLHDGAQQRLVALSMTLGMARLDLPEGEAAELIAKAHDQAGQALQEIRGLIHGIYPQVLIDHGLGAAIADAADRCPVPVELDVDLKARTSKEIESAAYFTVAEALTNIVRHSGASRARIEAGYRDGRLVIEIADNGRGGADADAGSGLSGLADRISMLDGRLVLASPPGGPTLLRVEIPCDAPEPENRPG